MGITDFRNISVYAGITNLLDTRGVRRVIKSCTTDPLYAPGYPGFGDVASCTLDSPYVASPTTTAATGMKIAVVTVVKDDATLVNGTTCVAIGWGSTSMINLGSSFYANALQQIGVNILDNPSCQRMWPK